MIVEELKKTVSEALKTLGVQNPEVSLEHPAELSHGDYSTNAALRYAKELKKPPKEIAEVIVRYIVPQQISLIAKIEVAGTGFVNFHLSKEFFAEQVKEILEKKDGFGKTSQFKNQNWAIEYASPNPNKAMHLGHLRNVLTGIALCRLLEANGARVIREMVDNNRGIAIAKLMWGYLVSAKKDGTRTEDILYWSEHQYEWQTPQDVDMSPDRFIDELYVRGATEYENPKIEAKVRDLVVRWEAKDPFVWKLWEKVLSYAYAGQKKTLNRLGATFDYVWHEHEHYEEGKRYVKEGLQHGVFKKLDDGAILTNLSAYNLTDTVVVKKDGTSLYITQDIALTSLKRQKHQADKMIWIIGPEQSLAMKQLFAVCEQLGIGKRSEFIHISYGYVSLKGVGKMSSRKGNVIYIDDVIYEAKKRVLKLMEDRILGNIEIISEQIALAAIAFDILKSSRTADTAFDFDQALRLEGDTGPYLQYSYARARSVMQKATSSVPTKSVGTPPSREEMSETPPWKGGEGDVLLRLLYRFPEVVLRAGREYAPHYIASFLIELAGAFNSWYAKERILDAGDETPYRLAQTAAFAQVMKNGLWLLGITAPEEM